MSLGTVKPSMVRMSKVRRGVPVPPGLKVRRVVGERDVRFSLCQNWEGRVRQRQKTG